MRNVRLHSEREQSLEYRHYHHVSSLIVSKNYSLQYQMVGNKWNGTHRDDFKGHDSDAHLPEDGYIVLSIPNTTRLFVASFGEGLSH